MQTIVPIVGWFYNAQAHGANSATELNQFGFPAYWHYINRPATKKDDDDFVFSTYEMLQPHIPAGCALYRELGVAQLEYNWYRHQAHWKWSHKMERWFLEHHNYVHLARYVRDC